MPQHPARTWSGTAGTRATATAATVAAAVFVAPAVMVTAVSAADEAYASPTAVHSTVPAALAAPIAPAAIAALGAVGAPLTGGVLPVAVTGGTVPSGGVAAAAVAPVVVPAAVSIPTAPAAPAAPNSAESMRAAVLATAPQRTLATVLAPPAPAAAPAGAQPAAEPAKAAVIDTKSSVALAAAMSARGTPYRWGATGRGGFDCSGLALWAYRKAGITLPRTSRSQSGVGTPVSRNELRPGDLVFFNRPVSHVGIYVGDDQVVHAPQSGDVVKVSPLGRMRFSSARRLA